MENRLWIVWCAIYFFACTLGVYSGLLNSLNQVVHLAVQSIGNHVYIHVIAMCISCLDMYVGMSIVFLILGILLYYRCFYVALVGLILYLCIPISSIFLKQIIAYPRPVDYLQYAAFPSGHTLSITFLFGCYNTLLRHSKYYNWLQVCSILCMAIARMLLQAHWLMDVLGGFLLGYILVRLLHLCVHQHLKDLRSFQSLVLYVGIGLWVINTVMIFHSQLIYYHIVW